MMRGPEKAPARCRTVAGERRDAPWLSRRLLRTQVYSRRPAVSIVDGKFKRGTAPEGGVRA